MEMGKEIRRLRDARGITQEVLAQALNVTAQTVSKWECGSSMPDVQTLPRIALFRRHHRSAVRHGARAADGTH